MATFVPGTPAPILDRSLQQALLGFAQPFSQGLAAMGQRRMTQRDLALLASILQQQGQLPSGQMGGLPLPQPVPVVPKQPTEPGGQISPLPPVPDPESRVEWDKSTDQWIARSDRFGRLEWDTESQLWRSPEGFTLDPLPGLPTEEQSIEGLQPAPPQQASQAGQQMNILQQQMMQARGQQIGGGGQTAALAGILGQLRSPFGQQIAMQMLNQQMMRTADLFTLGPGGRRFDAAGNLIAQAPFRPLAPPTPRAPTAFEQTSAEIGRLAAIPKAQRTPTQQARLDQLLARKPLLPSQKISQKKLDEINRLQAKVDKGTITKPEQARLDKMLAGAPLVEISLGKPPSPAERTAIAETRASIDALNNLKTLFDSAQTKVGPIVGRAAPFKGLLGLTTDEQEDFMAATSAFKNRIIKEITGAQMSEQEANRIMKQIPDITDPPARWNAKWRQSKKNLEFLQKRRAEILRQSGLRVPETTGQLVPITDPNKIDAIGNEFGF